MHCLFPEDGQDVKVSWSGNKYNVFEFDNEYFCCMVHDALVTATTTVVSVHVCNIGF